MAITRYGLVPQSPEMRRQWYALRAVGMAVTYSPLHFRAKRGQLKIIQTGTFGRARKVDMRLHGTGNSKLPWRKAGLPRHLDDVVNSDQKVVNERTLCLWQSESVQHGPGGVNVMMTRYRLVPPSPEIRRQS